MLSYLHKQGMLDATGGAGHYMYIEVKTKLVLPSWDRSRWRSCETAAKPASLRLQCYLPTRHNNGSLGQRHRCQGNAELHLGPDIVSQAQAVSVQLQHADIQIIPEDHSAAAQQRSLQLTHLYHCKQAFIGHTGIIKSLMIAGMCKVADTTPAEPLTPRPLHPPRSKPMHTSTEKVFTFTGFAAVS